MRLNHINQSDSILILINDVQRDCANMISENRFPTLVVRKEHGVWYVYFNMASLAQVYSTYRD